MSESEAALHARIAEGFANQPVMDMLGARLAGVTPGEVRLSMVHADSLGQQDGFLHAGIITTLVDSACGFAALSRMPPGSRVLSIEFKINMLKPANAPSYLAVGRVLRSGRQVSVCRGELHAGESTEGPVLAAMQASMICVPPEGR